MRARLLLVVLLLSPSALLASNQLWDKAVEITRGTVDWVPGNAAFVLELLDGKGKTQETWHSWYRLEVGAGGAVQMVVVKATHNDQDTTAKEQDNQRRRKQDPFTRWDNPFDPRVQGTVTLSAGAGTEAIDGRLCALFDFTLVKKDHATLSGRAWLDAATGAPVQVRYTSSPLPRGVFEMTTTLRFGQGPGKEGFLREALVEGVGGILFIRKSFRSVITVDGWWRRGSS